MSVRIYFTIFVLIIPMFAIANDVTPVPLFIVHFETGANWNKSLQPAEQAKFQEHSANLNSLRDDGTIVFGARYGDLGMIIIKAKSLEAAKLLLEADPGVRSGIFNFRVESLSVFYPWQQ
ncbi:MAG: YciI family protein [Pseudomonadales bacterium]